MLETLNWAIPSEEHFVQIVERLKEYLGDLEYHPETTQVRFSYLPFYDYFSLIEVDDPFWPQNTCPLWFIGNHSILWPLDGSSSPIHDANELGRIHVTADNVIAYMNFFCFFVHGDCGPFIVVKDADHPVFDADKITAEEKIKIGELIKPVAYLTETEDGTHEVYATVLYGNALFGARFAITPVGMIEMIDDEPLMADIPARKIKPNY